MNSGKPSKGSGEPKATRKGRKGKRPLPPLTWVAKHVVELTPEQLEGFSPGQVSLAEIGALFTFVDAALCGVKFAREEFGTPKGVSNETWDQRHLQFRIAVQFAKKCVDGLGSRLEATGLVPGSYAIEKRARELVRVLFHGDLILSGGRIGKKRTGLRPPDGLFVAAGELSALGRLFADVPPEKDKQGKANLEHAPDFSWLRVGTKVFHFNAPSQKSIIKALYGQWIAAGEKDGCGLGLATLIDETEAATTRLRVRRAFSSNPALGTLIRHVGKGQWALFINEILAGSLR